MTNEKHEHNCSCGHNHEHGEGCGCGGHHHEHGEGCGCGGHNHEHGEGCGCGGHHHHDENHQCKCSSKTVKAMDFSEFQEQFLMDLSHKTYLPLVRFIMLSTKSDDIESVALAPVYITSENESIQSIKETGKMLLELEKNGYITLDYDEELGKYDYSEYDNSPVFAELKDIVAQGAQKENFLFDIAEIEKGSIAMTQEFQSSLAHHHH
ncbi:MAG: hypothetical protein R3Y33_05520 [Clostridia bacterium]